MRKDVKLGLVVSLAVVLIGGGYFLFGGRDEAPVDLSGASAKPDALAGKDAPSPAGPAKKPGERVAGANKPGSASQPRPSVTPSSSKPLEHKPPVDTRASGAPSSVALPPPVTAPGAQPVRDGSAAPRPTTDGLGAQPGDSPSSAPNSTAGAKLASPADIKPLSSSTPPAAKPETARATDAGRTEGTIASKLPPLEPAVAAPTKPATGDSKKPMVETHRVQQGETFASLARSYYGDPRLAEFLTHVNGQIGAKLTPGMVVNIPPAPTDKELASLTREMKAAREKPAGAAPADAPKDAAKVAAADDSARKTAVTGAAKTTPTPTAAPADDKRTYTVKSGDTFYGIAKDQLGASSRWKEIFELNKSVVKGDPKSLRPGQVIVLPHAAAKAGA